jgi:thioredoxin 1
MEGNKEYALNLAPLEEVSEANFKQKVLEHEAPLLVVFWAPWSEPCRIMISVLKRITSTRKSLSILAANADNNLLLSMGYQIQSIPTLMCFVRGYERDRIIGTASEEAILSKFLPHLESASEPPPASNPS